MEKKLISKNLLCSNSQIAIYDYDLQNNPTKNLQNNLKCSNLASIK